MAESNFTPGTCIPQGKIKGNKTKRPGHPIAETKPKNKPTTPSPVTFTLKEIKTLQTNLTQIKYLTLIKTQHHPKPRYEIHFTFHNKHHPIRATLITTRNKPYQLANLDRGIKFLQELFLDVEVIEVRL